MSNSTKIVTAVLAGLAAGAALGVLIAPGQGRENRQSLRESLDDFQYSVSETANDRLWKLSKWRGRMFSFALGLLKGQAAEMPDDLEHA